MPALALDWLLFNALVPLSSIPLVFFGLWLVGQPKSLILILRDGQLFFYCAVTLSIFLKDAVRASVSPEGFLWSAGAFLVFSTFVYGIAVVYSDQDDLEMARRIGRISALATIATIGLVVWARATLGML